jgi:iron(III) transport system ATP-binding protein
MAGIHINNISKSYGAKSDMPAVSNMEINIPDNTFLTLLGPSGCGKTTTLRLIAGYLEPDSGEIRVNGRLLSAKGNVVPPERRGMGMVFQNYAVWPHKTVFENVAFGLMIRKTDKREMEKAVAEALAMVNLTGYEGRYPNELSGGQQQRVALARSLVVRPDILLLDEPLSNLDAKLRERMRGELKELQRRTGITFVYVTHDQAEALALSDQIAVIHEGKLQQLGRPVDVYVTPANRFVADFMGTVNMVRGEVANGQFACKDFTLSGVSAQTGAADLVVRPENIVLNAADAGLCHARVLDRVFLGNLCEYQIALASGATLRVQTHPLQLLDQGADVSLSIEANRCTFFAA